MAHREDHHHAGALERSLTALDDWHPALAGLWDREAIRREADDALASPEPSLKALMGTNRALATLRALNGWWQALDG